jgi:CheY-like chemotaxis protein
VIDDEDLARRSTLRLLAQLGFRQLFEASSAAQALELLATLRPGLVLTDMSMETPLAGLEVVRFATANQIAVAVVSGRQPCLPRELDGTLWIAKDHLSLTLLERELPALLAAR